VGKPEVLRQCRNRNWVFKSGDVELIEMAKIPIVRHIKIRKDANPFDTDYSEYLEKK
jgi:RNA-directed DNA polymerase